MILAVGCVAGLRRPLAGAKQDAQARRAPVGVVGYCRPETSQQHANRFTMKQVLPFHGVCLQVNLGNTNPRAGSRVPGWEGSDQGRSLPRHASCDAQKDRVFCPEGQKTPDECLWSCLHEAGRTHDMRPEGTSRHRPSNRDQQALVTYDRRIRDMGRYHTVRY